ncbi:Kinase [Hexamita inflata]|uniref:non-specific serine/threonine protein kinase n=1 Tax=Hexamita inflata TaxID=28002 RepID=A0AA86RBK1_9EUKA|nr:AGC PDK1 [Hexamita inflata]
MSNIAGLFNTIDASRSTDFVLQQLLGEGAFGKVSKAIHIPTKIKLALKEVDVAKLEQIGELRTLTREMELLQAIRDQNIYNLIPRYYGHYQLQSKVYLTSELCTHGDLTNLVKYCGKVPANIVKYIASQLISLVERLHSLGFAHRDIKPGNILINDQGKLVLTDFGTANHLSPLEVLLSQGKIPITDLPTENRISFVGTDAYLPPEQRSATAFCSPPLDAYCVGCVIYELVYNQMFTGDYSLIKGDTAPLLLKLLDADPSRRFNGWPQIKKLPYFKTINFDDLGCINFDLFFEGRKLTQKILQEELVKFTVKNIKLQQTNQQLKQNNVLLDDEQLVFHQTYKKFTLYMTTKKRLLINDQTINMSAQEFRIFSSPGTAYIQDRTANLEIPMSEEQFEELSKKIEETLFHSMPLDSPIKCPECGAKSYSQYCNECYYFSYFGQKMFMNQVLQLDQSVLPYQMREQALIESLKKQEREINVKLKNKETKVNFADLFGGNEGENEQKEEENDSQMKNEWEFDVQVEYQKEMFEKKLANQMNVMTVEMSD